MIDLHAHILPGLDDGVATLDEARELARRAAGEGVTAIAATPHVRDDYPTTAAQMQQALARVHDDFASEQIAVDVLPGVELAIDRLPQIAEDELQQRSREVQAEPERLDALVEDGALVQITAASLDGRLGPSSRRAAQALIERGHAHLLASDAHGPSIREAGLTDAASAVGNKRLARWLTSEAPAAIVAGESLPERPRRGWFGR